MTKPMSVFERRAWAALLVLSALLRLASLGERPFHHDESIHAWFSDHLAFEGDYKYDPVYHGPVQYAMVAAAFRLGTLTGFLDYDERALRERPELLWRGDVLARAPAALGGVALVALALLLRPRFGKGAAFAAGALLALSPNVLYYTRFCREDVWSLLGTAGAFLYFDSWLRTKRLAHLAGSALFLAVAFASKENFYVLVALMAPSIVAAWWEPGRGFDVFGRLRRLLDVLERHTAALAGALLLFFTVSELLYTVLLVHPESGNPAREAISYWWQQHSIQRVGGPWYFYFPRLLQYEFAILLPALFLIFRRWRALTMAERFLAGWGISSLLMYAYLGEKTPWLIVHQLLPFVPLAALAWASLASAGPILRWAGAGTAALSALSALSLCFWYPAITPKVDKAESVIYVQTTPEARALAGEVYSAAKAGAVPAAAVFGEANWPYSWYLRRIPVDWALPNPDRPPAIAVVDAEKADEVAEKLGPGYRREPMPLRAWWLPALSAKPLRPSPRELLTYLLARRPWRGENPNENPIGAQDVIVFRRVGQNPPAR